MNAVELIERKRDGGRLTDDEIRWLIAGYTDGSIPDYQMAAMAMAVYLRGLDDVELAAWTAAMLHSGDVLSFPEVEAPKADKHSTGGVGDKISIPLGPIVAACGVAIPMMSGRGLGHTGGTLDKLESIPGFQVQFGVSEFGRLLQANGLVLAGQSASLVPADRKLYALRDTTGTVSSIPLIASSIMSKKLAEGLDALVLDVKFGSGAFMETLEQARILAQTMVGIGKAHGVQTVAMLTDMNVPLGREVGNAGEIRESIAVLMGTGPEDVRELTLSLGAEMLTMTGLDPDREAAIARMEDAISSGAALEKFVAVVTAQGGDPAPIYDPGLLPLADHEFVIKSDTSGFVTSCDARKVGVAAMRLGAGRERKEDTIDPGVGITVDAKPGETVEPGSPLATLRYRHPARLEEALRAIDGAWTTSPEPVDTSPLIVERVE